MRSMPQRSAVSAAAKARMPVSTLMISRMPRSAALLDHFVAHAVAFEDAVRHVILGLAAAQLDDGLEDDDGGGAVHVVVAIDKTVSPRSMAACKRSTASRKPVIRYGECR